MAQYKVQTPDGKTITLEGPDNATDDQILAAAAELYNGNKADDAARDTFLGKADAAVRGLSDSVTFGFADEINAAINAVAPLDRATGNDVKSVWDKPGLEDLVRGGGKTSFKEAFDHNMNQQKRTTKADERVNPKSRGAGQVAGVVGSVAAPFTILRGAKAAANTARGAAAANAGRAAGQALAPGYRVLRAAPGATVAAKAVAPVAKAASKPVSKAAAVGAAYGAASGYGSGDTAANRAQSAKQGAVVGAAGGAALHKTVTGLTPLVQRYWNAFRGEGALDEALGQMQKALQRDGYDVTSPAGVKALEAELSKFAGRPVMLADVGRNSRARTGVGLRTPSDAQNAAADAVLDRQSGSAQRLKDDVLDNVAPRTDVVTLDKELIAQRDSTALPLKREALVTANPNATPLYHGGAKLTDDYEGLTYLTPSREVAESYVPMHEERFGGTGTVNEVMADTRNFATQAEVEQAARGLGMDMNNGTPASLFDVNLQGEYAVNALVQALKQRGFAGAKDLPDIPYGRQGEALATIPFDKRALNVPATAPRVVDDEVLQELARNPLAQRALADANEWIGNERQLRQTLGQNIDDLPAPFQPGDKLDMRAFDLLKRRLDDAVDSAYAGTGSFTKAEATQLKELRNAIVQRLRGVGESSAGAADGPYAQYLDAYAGTSELRDALRAGSGVDPTEGTRGGVAFDSVDPATIKLQQADRSQAGQEFYRVGAARRIMDLIGNPDSPLAQPARRLNSNELGSRLEAAGVAPGGVARLQQGIQQERQMGQLTNELTGSQTDARLAARADADANNLGGMTPGNVTSPGIWAGKALNVIGGAVDLKRNAAVNEELLPRMVNTDLAGIKRTIEELVAAGKVEEARSLARIAAGRMAAAGFGNIIGRQGAVTTFEEQ